MPHPWQAPPVDFIITDLPSCNAMRMLEELKQQALQTVAQAGVTGTASAVYFTDDTVDHE